MLIRLAALLISMIPLLLSPLSGESAAPADLTGFWMDSWSQRAHMDLTQENGEYTAVIHWAGSAFEHVEWRMSGTFDEYGVLTSDNCTKSLHSFDEEGSESVEILYENEKAALICLDGVITWQDAEGMGAECRFIRTADGSESHQTEP